MPSSVLSVLRDALLDALAIVLPVECGGCGAPDRGLCASCRAALAPHPVVRSAAGVAVWSGLRYEDVPRRVILAMKDAGRTDLSRALAPALAAAVGAGRACGADVHLVAVPSSFDGRRRRGYDPIRLIASAAGLRTETLLTRVRGGAQKTLGAEERSGNARGSLRARRHARGRRILLIDDVVTTGATLAEAKRVLVEAGAEVVGAAVIASTPLRRAASAASETTTRRHSGDVRRLPGDTVARAD